jgi:hypothetical protein
VGAAAFEPLAQQGFKFVTQPSQLARWMEANWDGVFKLVYRPMVGDKVKHFDAACELVEACGRMVFAVDEIDFHMSPAYMPLPLYKLNNYGRHRKVAMIGTARRHAQVARDYTAMLTEMDVFRFTEPRDLEWLSAKAGPGLVNTVGGLAPYHYARWFSDGRIDVRNRKV